MLPSAGHVEVSGQAVSIAVVPQGDRVVVMVDGVPTFALTLISLSVPEPDALGPARGTIEYAEILERRVKEQRDQLELMNQDMRETGSNRAVRKRVAALERLLGVKELQLQRHRDAVVALNRKLAALEEAP